MGASLLVFPLYRRSPRRTQHPLACRPLSRQAEIIPFSGQPMTFKSIAEFLDPKNGHRPTSAERDLIAKTRTGEPCRCWKGKEPSRPDGPSDDTTIRAALLRLLIIGGTKDCGLHERGVWLEGGWIEGELDLSFCTGKGAALLAYCHFTDRPNLNQTTLPQLSLDDSALPGLFAQGAVVAGGFFLRRIVGTGTVAVGGVQVGGQLDCTGATLDGGKDMHGNALVALNAQGAEVGPDFFLGQVTAIGTVTVGGAKIGGQLSCIGAKLYGGKDARGAALDALNAQGVEVGQDLFLSQVTARGTVTVGGAKIGGQLGCTGATLDGGKDMHGTTLRALNAQGVKVGQDLFLSQVTAIGTVDVIGARIGGQLDCTDATLVGGKDKNGTALPALHAQRLQVSQGFFFRDLVKVQGLVDLTAARFADLVDDPACWPVAPDNLILNGFTYDRIGGPTTFAARRNWLVTGSHWLGEFYPQPYTQFAKILRQMGHAREARKVLIGMAEAEAKTLQKRHRARRRLVRALRRFSATASVQSRDSVVGILDEVPASLKFDAKVMFDLFAKTHMVPPDLPGSPSPLSKITREYAKQDFRNRMRWLATKSRIAILWSRIKTGFFGITVGHGHAPHRSLVLALGCVGVSSLVYMYLWSRGVMVPTDAVILTSTEWATAYAGSAEAPSLVWASGKGPATQHYETFYSLPYALDVFLPIVDLGQQSTWGQTTVTNLGVVARIYTWLLQAAGYIITSLGLAAATGIIQRNQPD